MKKITVILRIALLVTLGGIVMLVQQQARAETEEVSLAQNWEQTTLTSPPATGSAIQPGIVVSEQSGKIVATFSRRNEAGDENFDPFYRISTNNGKSWQATSRINTTSGVSSIQIDATIDSADNAHAVWVEDKRIIAYARESQWNAGTNYTTIDSVTSGLLASNPRIVSSGSGPTLDVVWTAQTSFAQPGFNIYYARKVGSGNWTTPKIVSNGSIYTDSESAQPDLAITNNGILHLVWQEQITPSETAVYYARSTNGGSSWSGALNLTDITDAQHNSIQPRIKAIGNTIDVTFGDLNDRDTPSPSDDLQSVYYLNCPAVNCTVGTNWNVNDAAISGQSLKVNGSDPFYIYASMDQWQGCTLAYFHGIPNDGSSSEEQIYGVSSCNGWGNARSQITSSRAIKPVFAVQNNWQTYMVYEDAVADNHKIIFLRSEPKNYLPSIFNGAAVP